MFTLSGEHAFEPDADMCWLSALLGYGDDFYWVLHLQSQSAVSRFTVESARASFGIHVHPAFGVRHWCELSGQSFEIPLNALRNGFMFHCDMSQQWEDLIDLRQRVRPRRLFRGAS